MVDIIRVYYCWKIIFRRQYCGVLYGLQLVYEMPFRVEYQQNLLNQMKTFAIFATIETNAKKRLNA